MDLEKDITRARSKHHVFAWLVIAGLALEVIHAWNQPTSWCEKFLPLLADFLVFSGVFGETYYSSKASNLEDKQKRESEERIAELTREAENAKLETEKIRERLAPRSLTREQFNALQELKGQTFEIIIYSTSGSESVNFSKNILRALETAQLDVSMPTRLINGLSGTGVMLSFPDSVEDIHSHPLYLIFQKLELISYAMNRKQLSMEYFPSEAIIIMVFEK